MNEIQQSKELDSDNLENGLLYEHNSVLAKDLKTTWSKIYTDHLLVIFQWQEEFINLSEIQCKASSSHFDRLGKLSSLIRDFYNPKSKNSVDPFASFKTNLVSSKKVLSQQLPEKVVRILDPSNLVSTAGDSKAEIRKKTSKTLKKRMGLTAKSRVPFQSYAQFHLDYSGTNMLRGVLRKLSDMESVFQEAWIQTMLSQNPESSDFDALKTLVAEDQQYLENYILDSAHFIAQEIKKDSFKIDHSSLENEHLLQRDGLPRLESALSNEIHAFGLASNKSKLLLSLSLAQINFGVSNELKILKEMADAQLYGPSLKELERIENWLQALETSSTDEFEKLELLEHFSFDDLQLNESMQRIQQLTSEMPSEITLSNFDNKIQIVDAAYLSDSLLDEIVQLPLQGYLFELPNRYASAISSLATQVRMVEFSKNNKFEAGKAIQGLKKSIEECYSLLARAKEGIEEIQGKFNSQLDQILKKIEDRLSSESLIKAAREFNRIAQRKQRLSVVSNYFEKLSKPFKLYGDKFRQLLSNTHKDIVYSEFRSQTAANESSHARLRTFMESISPNPSALEELPFYYQQLFIGKHAPKANLFHFREREMQMAQVAIERLNQGTGGAIAVLGDPLSGRSFFCDMLCLGLNSPNIFRIDPPFNGSANPNKLYQTLSQQLHTTALGSKVLDKAPENSVFLFNDIELWWERHEAGWSALLALKKLIAKYSHKHLFIFNTTPYAYRLMRLQMELDTEIIATIPLSPFSPKELEKVVQQRHNTGGLNFTLNNNPGHLISKRQRQFLINDLNDVTDGNVGATFHLWLGLMKECDGEIMHLHSPKQKELPILEKKDHLVVLAQIVLHKSVSPKKLSRILNCPLAEAHDRIQNLHRSGLIVEVMGGSFRVVPYALPYVIRQLKEFQLI